MMDGRKEGWNEGRKGGGTSQLLLAGGLGLGLID